MNRILLAPDEIAADGCVVLTDERALHIRFVLRCSIGDQIRIGLIDGPTGEASVAALEADGVKLTCRFDHALPELPPVDLLLAMPRPKVMKRLWAPLASLGIGHIIITNAARVEPNYFATHWLDPSRYRGRILEGLQQTGLTRMPDVVVARRFRPLIEDQLDALSPNTDRLVAHPYDAAPLRIGVRTEPFRRVLLAIGPEGGWVPFEIELMRTAGFRVVSFPFGSLRTDVACMVGLALVRQALMPAGSASSLMDRP